MLVIVSDLHLNDGTTGALLDAGAAELLTDRVCDLAYRACWRADGSYQPIQRVDLVLLGDVFDIIRSQRWLTSDVRPWSDLHSPAGVEMVSGITSEILRKNVEIIRQLRSGAQSGRAGTLWMSSAAACSSNCTPRMIGIAASMTSPADATSPGALAREIQYSA